MDLAEKFLSHPILWGVLAVIAFAVTLSGKLSVAASTVLMWVAYGLAVFGVYRLVASFEWGPSTQILSAGATACVLAIGTIRIVHWLNDKPQAAVTAAPANPSTDGGSTNNGATPLPKVDVQWDDAKQWIVIFNPGNPKDRTFYACGFQMGPMRMQRWTPPQMVRPNDFIYLDRKGWKEEIVRNFGLNGKERWPITVLLLDEDKKTKFVGKFGIFMSVLPDGNVVIRTQMWDVVREDWLL